jgi:hypothetical protein
MHRQEDTSTMSTTTPERSESSSPAREPSTASTATSETDSDLAHGGARPGPVRNICCVGAGYVGT